MAKAKTPVTAGRPKLVELKRIRIDGETQSRVELNQDVIKEYAGLMKDGVEFPPLVVVFDGSDYWLVDGFHRRWGAIDAKLPKLKCLVSEGTKEDARWMSYGANKDHGLKRSNEDKQRAVQSALKHPNALKWSDARIAAHVGVSDRMIAKYRPAATPKLSESVERVGADGRTINTANIGRPANPVPRVITGTLADAIESPTEEDEVGDCPKGGDHEFSDGACVKCYEPAERQPPKPVKPSHYATFDDLLEHIRQAIRLTDDAHRETGKKWGKLHESVMNSLDIAGQEAKKWRGFCK